MSKSNRKILAGELTRAALIEAARTLFASGYDTVSTPSIVAKAGVTRGALYHHFADKRALFEAVVEQVARDLVAEIDAAATDSENDPAAAIVAGSGAFVSACLNQQTRQIFLVDAPAILGWATWRAIDARHGLGSLKDGLGACADAGLIKHADITPIAHLISGALNEVVFMLVDDPDDTDLPQVLNTHIGAMIHGLLKPL